MTTAWCFSSYPNLGPLAGAMAADPAGMPVDLLEVHQVKLVVVALVTLGLAVVAKMPVGVLPEHWGRPALVLDLAGVDQVEEAPAAVPAGSGEGDRRAKSRSLLCNSHAWDTRADGAGVVSVGLVGTPRYSS